MSWAKGNGGTQRRTRRREGQLQPPGQSVEKVCNNLFNVFGACANLNFKNFSEFSNTVQCIWIYVFFVIFKLG